MITSLLIAYAINNYTNKCMNKYYPIATSMNIKDIKKDIRIINIHDKANGNNVRYLIVKKDYETIGESL